MDQCEIETKKLSSQWENNIEIHGMSINYKKVIRKGNITANFYILQEDRVILGIFLLERMESTSTLVFTFPIGNVNLSVIIFSINFFPFLLKLLG